MHKVNRLKLSYCRRVNRLKLTVSLWQAKLQDIDSGRMHWWILLKAEEEILTALEGDWARVALQLSLQLEPCFKLSSIEEHSDTPHHSDAAANNGVGSSNADTYPSDADSATNKTQTQTPIENIPGNARPNQDWLAYSSTEGDSSHRQPGLHHKVSGGMLINDSLITMLTALFPS